MKEPDPTNPDPVKYFLAKLQQLREKSRHAFSIEVELPVKHST